MFAYLHTETHIIIIVYEQHLKSKYLHLNNFRDIPIFSSS